MHRPGFSLIELVIALSIVAIMALMVTPRFAGATTRYRIDAASRRLAGDIVMAQQTAESSGSSVTIVFDKAADQYGIGSMKDLDGADAPYIVQLADEPYKATIVSIQSGTDTSIKFDGFGMPDAAAQVTLQVGAYSKVVTVSATGEVNRQ